MSTVLLVTSLLAAVVTAPEMPVKVTKVTPAAQGSRIQLTNVSERGVTAWAVATSTTSGDRTHREVATADGYLSELTHGLPGASAQLERLAPGEVREIAVGTIPAGATVEIVAAVMDDATAVGDETVIASIFAHRVKERDALRAVVDSFNAVLPSQQGPEALAALRERFSALAQRDDSVPCRAALDAVQNYSSKTSADDINQSLRAYAAFVTKQYELAVKHATRRPG
ncbi:MAG TPA: hypothetical protein VGH34_20400 [Vicinamibacterales bacterium]|jgi:hypothetical protein